MSCRSCPLDDLQSMWKNGWVLPKKSCKNILPQPTLFQKKRLTTWSLKTLLKNAIQKKTFTMNYRGHSKRHPICRGKLLSAHQGGAGRRCYGATWLTWNRSIDRFHSHFRPVVMEIEIGGRSEKSLGGQESAAVDQECMGSNARSCSVALSFQIRLPFFAGTCLMSRTTNSP